MSQRITRPPKGAKPPATRSSYVGGATVLGRAGWAVDEMGWVWTTWRQTSWGTTAFARSAGQLGQDWVDAGTQAGETAPGNGPGQRRAPAPGGGTRGPEGSPQALTGGCQQENCDTQLAFMRGSVDGYFFTAFTGCLTERDALDAERSV